MRPTSGEDGGRRSALRQDLTARLAVLLDLGLGYLSLERSTPTLSPGELQRLRLATQLHSNLFGVVYVLDEPSAGLHPADTEALLDALDATESCGQFAVCGGARAGCDAACGLDRGCGAGGGGAWRRGAVLGAAGRAARCGGFADAAVSLSSGETGAGEATRAEGVAQAERHHAQQSQLAGRGVSAWAYSRR